jgi:hypothetical protein
MHDVHARHRGRALRRLGKGSEDTYGGCLAGAVVAEEAEHCAGRNVEVEVAQGPEVAEALAEAAGDDTAVAAG